VLLESLRSWQTLGMHLSVSVYISVWHRSEFAQLLDQKSDPIFVISSSSPLYFRQYTCIMMTQTPTTKGRIITYRYHPTESKTLTWIGKTEKIPCQTVSDICAHWKTHGPVYELPCSGRPLELTDWDQKAFIEDIWSNPKAKFDVFGEVRETSPSTVCRVAHKHGFNSRICRKKAVRYIACESKEEGGMGKGQCGAALESSDVYG